MSSLSIEDVVRHEHAVVQIRVILWPVARNGFDDLGTVSLMESQNRILTTPFQPNVFLE